MSFGGKFLWDDDRQTPNTQIAYLDYPAAPIIFEMRNLSHSPGDSAMDLTYRRLRTPIVIECEHGYYAGGWAFDYQDKKIRQFEVSGGGDHHANFIEAMRSRKVSDLNADILDGHISTSLCHLGNISYRLGRGALRAEIAETLHSDRALQDMFARFQDHLLLNRVDVQQTPRMLGPWLEIDAEQERFVGEFSEQANAHLRRSYRAPFVVPEQV